MSSKKNNDTHTKNGEGFAEKVERLSRETGDNTSDTPVDNDFQPVMTTANEPGEHTTEVRIIKKRSVAGWLGFLFGATALAGLGYWYQHQNGWHWPPQTTTQVKPADLQALEKRLDSLRQELPTLARQAAESAIAPVKAQIDSLQTAQLAEPATDATTSPALEALQNQLNTLQEQLQQAHSHIADLQKTLAESQADTHRQLQQMQQQLQQASAPPLITPAETQSTHKLMAQLRLQQALNAVENAQLALAVQHRPQAADWALQQAIEQLNAVPDSETIIQQLKQSREQISARQQQPDTITPALTEAMRNISNWHWQPATTASTEKTGTSWLERLVIVKKIDQTGNRAMTLAEEEHLKRTVLDALNTAALARQHGDQNTWQKALGRAIDNLSPVAKNQPELAAVASRLEALMQTNIRPHWPDLHGIQQQIKQQLDTPAATAIEPHNATETTAP